ncbi:hypothetical protein [Mycolicibacter arupensis]|jgi:hypothetical protein|uniref:Uncharacterized protein n=2 Tax=Mycolicibacter arupensis TaxID=342002 RepID=A0A0F5MV50_9MYCO|nr:hypothetical protein [Mycolicibacter arupensis]KKB98576.1 hypothetical protein WR43_13870 [Mycolicibacter arupensis]OQZ94096.1 hypothetical protein BST15_17180 [Mycolicibacter arupensis]TXI59973.1 MAG: hypothetical protein E6Q54_01515 [Mycolicibacter arupensis]
MATKARRCERCGKRLRSLAAAEGWNVRAEGGYPVGLICPGCQSPAENAEAIIHEATLDYGLDEFGRMVARVKGGL